MSIIPLFSEYSADVGDGCLLLHGTEGCNARRFVRSEPPGDVLEDRGPVRLNTVDVNVTDLLAVFVAET